MNAPSVRPGGTRHLPTTVLVARREVRMRLRSRVFVGGTIVMTVLVVVGIVAASLLAGKTNPVRVGFSGGSQALERSFTASAAALGAKVTVSDIADVTAGKAQVTAGTLDVLVTGSSTAPTAVAKAAIPSNVESALSLAAEAARLSDAGLSPAAVTSAMALVPVQLLQPPNSKDTENLFASLALGILLWIALGQYGNMAAQSVVEEKATRIMEILLATIQPSRLLAGKVIGIGLVGLLQLTVVGAAALVAVQVTNVAAIPALGPGLDPGRYPVVPARLPLLRHRLCRGRLPRLAPGGGPERRRADLDLPDRGVPAHVRRAAESEWPPGHGGLAASAVRPNPHGGADGGERRAGLAGRPGGSADRRQHRRPDLARRPHLQPTPRSTSARGCASWMRSVGNARG